MNIVHSEYSAQWIYTFYGDKSEKLCFKSNNSKFENLEKRNVAQNECKYCSDKSSNFCLNLNKLYKRNTVHNQCTQISFEQITGYFVWIRIY